MENVIVNGIDITDLVISFESYDEMNENMIIGSAVSRQIKLKIKNKDNQLEGMLDYPFIIGNKTYIVYEKPEKWTKNISVTLYDYMILSNIVYDTKIEYPTTVSTQLDEMSKLMNISIDKTSLSEELLNKTVDWYDNTMIIRNYIGFIAECDGKNAFVEDDRIVFKSLATSTHITDFCSDYELNELLTFTRVCYDDGLIIPLSAGDETGKTLYISFNNSYIEQSDVERIYKMYHGLSFYSFKKFKCKIDRLELTDLVSYDDIVIMPLSIKRTVYGGEARDSLELAGDITIKNADSVIVKEDPLKRIKRIQTTVDQSNAKIEIIAKEQEGISGRQSELEVSLDNVFASVESVESRIESLSERNLIIRTNETEGYIVGKNGEAQKFDNHCISDFIEVYSYDAYALTKRTSELLTPEDSQIIDDIQEPNDTCFRYAFYDDEKFFVEWHIKNEDLVRLTIPENVSFMKISYPKDSFPKLNKGEIATDYSPAPEDIDNSINSLVEEIKQLASMMLDEKSFSIVLNTVISETLNGYFTKEEIMQYMRFENGILSLGSNDSDFKTELSQSKLAFKENDTEIAWISNKQLHIKEAVVEERINIDPFIIEVDSNGLTIK